MWTCIDVPQLYSTVVTLVFQRGTCSSVWATLNFYTKLPNLSPSIHVVSVAPVCIPRPLSSDIGGLCLFHNYLTLLVQPPLT